MSWARGQAACGRAMVRTKTVSRKAGGGTVPAGVPTPTSLVLTQDVQAAEAQATAAAQRVAQLREAQRQASSDIVATVRTRSNVRIVPPPARKFSLG